MDYVRDCTTKDCANYPYRHGKNPAREGMGNAKNLQKPTREWGGTDPKPVYMTGDDKRDEFLKI
jgi:hypothetical protein